MTDPFTVLGIERKGASERDVRKAYARKLKNIHPDDDPEGFMQLRESYEAARDMLKWADEDDKETGFGPHEYNEALDLWLDGSPQSQLLEACGRWMVERQCADPAGFFRELNTLTAYADIDARASMDNWLMFRLCEETGYKHTPAFADDAANPKPDPIRPVWLTDEVIAALHRNMNWWSQQPDNEWQADHLNHVLDLIEPQLVKDGLLGKQTTRHDVREIQIRQVEKARADDHGSYYDRDACVWIDMSPVGVAVRDVKSLIEKHESAADVGNWQSILERETLHPIEISQQLDEELRRIICDQTGYGKQSQPIKPIWFSRDVADYLDGMFGWTTHAGRYQWQRQQYDWLYKLIDPDIDQVSGLKAFGLGERFDATGVASLGHQELPWLLRWNVLASVYIGYRLVVHLLGAF